MAKIIFYEENAAKLVEDFMNKIRANGARKAAFIDAKDIEERTKISVADKSTTIATTLTSIAGLISDLFILYPCSGMGTVLPAMTDTRVKEENIENVSVAVLRLTEENMDNIDGMEYIDLDAATTEITENTFIPDIKKILYLMTSERAGELVKNATQNSAIRITDVAELASHFKYDESVRVSIAIPQLSTGSWIDFFNTLELILEKEPIDAVYIECPLKERDYFLRSMVDILERSFVDGAITYAQNEKSYIEIVEREEEPAAEEETPTVDAEVVSD
jgi:hypothetical protein